MGVVICEYVCGEGGGFQFFGYLVQKYQKLWSSFMGLRKTERKDLTFQHSSVMES